MRKREVKIGMEVQHKTSGEYLGSVTKYEGGITMRVQVNGREERLATIYEVSPYKPTPTS